MKSIILFLSASMICANEPLSFERFVENYFLLSKSKMENSPSAWQDTREGYFRAYGAFKADQVIDSLNTKALNHYEAGIRHFKVMEKIRIEVFSGKTYDHLVTKSSKPTFNRNYFSSSKD
ncbi:MAG: hypothetical protein ACJZ2B_01310 [Candidatus Neomarinimicrobiota bacterium]